MILKKTEKKQLSPVLAGFVRFPCRGKSWKVEHTHSSVQSGWSLWSPGSPGTLLMKSWFWRGRRCRRSAPRGTWESAGTTSPCWSRRRSRSYLEKAFTVAHVSSSPGTTSRFFIKHYCIRVPIYPEPVWQADRVSGYSAIRVGNIKSVLHLLSP